VFGLSQKAQPRSQPKNKVTLCTFSGFGEMGFGEKGYGETGFGKMGFGEMGGHCIHCLHDKKFYG